MDEAQQQYYYDMLARGRAVLILRDGHVAGVVTFFVGDDDEKFLTHHVPWTLAEDNVDGATLYIDQFLAYKSRSMGAQIHREFNSGLKDLKKRFKNINKVKWVRVGAQFRKNKITEGVTNVIHCKNLKF